MTERFGQSGKWVVWAQDQWLTERFGHEKASGLH
jgi:hypothetical protein